MRKNLVELVGKIDGEIEKGRLLGEEQMARFALAVPRKSGTIDRVMVELPEHFFALGLAREGWLKIRGRMSTWNELEKGKWRLKIVCRGYEAEMLEGEAEPKNFVQLHGFVCKKPEFRVTPGGHEITDVMVAVPRGGSSVCDYLPCIAWGKTARIADYLHEGEKIKLEGRFQSRKYHKYLPGAMMEERTAYEISIIRMTWDEEGEDE